MVAKPVHPLDADCSGHYDDAAYRVMSSIQESDIGSPLLPQLEALVGLIIGDWGGSEYDSRAVVLAAYRIGLERAARACHENAGESADAIRRLDHAR